MGKTKQTLITQSEEMVLWEVVHTLATASVYYGGFRMVKVCYLNLENSLKESHGPKQI